MYVNYCFIYIYVYFSKEILGNVGKLLFKSLGSVRIFKKFWKSLLLIKNTAKTVKYYYNFI